VVEKSARHAGSRSFSGAHRGGRDWTGRRG